MSSLSFRTTNLTLLLPTLLYTLFSALPASAGPTDRGGGNAVVCFSSEKKDQKRTKKILEQIKREGQTLNRKLFPFVESIELNEIYELRSLRDEDGKPYSLIQIDPKQKPSEFMNAIIAKYQGTYASVLANMIQVGRQEFSQLNQVRQDTPISFVGDFNLLRTIDTERCAVVTVASQTSGSPDLLQIDEPLRLLMAEKSPISDRALMLHEYVLLYTRRVNRSSNSDSARAVLRMLLIDDPTLTPLRVLRILRGAGIINWDVETNLMNQIGQQLSNDIFLFASEVSEKLNNVWNAAAPIHPYQIARARFDRMFSESTGEKLCEMFSDSSWDGPCRSA
ncbi:MAG: hypothetical protein K2X47_04860, partial [Bdellovibrionales bacterium]|nr:hypothetical protein [Bdellovibrionales bacterium]